MRSVGILTVYMVIYGNYHCKDICTEPFRWSRLEIQKWLWEGLRDVQNKVSAVPEEDLRYNRHRGGKDSSPYEMPLLREDSQAGMADTDLIENQIMFTQMCERPSDELRRAGVKLETNTLAYSGLFYVSR